VHHLPVAHGLGARILGQQVLQDRGAGAALADDEQRRGDLLVVDLRVPLVGVLDPQPTLESAAAR
jgi:hypothetical protein